MRLSELGSLARDAQVTHESVATLMWWARGVATGADTQRQLEVAERAVSIAERAEQLSNVLSITLDAWADEVERGELGAGGDE